MADPLIRLEERKAEMAQAIKLLLEISSDPSTRERLVHALITSVEQSYFWTPEWQAGEAQADKELAEGEYKTFDSMHEMLSFLAKDM